MKKIPLTQGMIALVDDEDYEKTVQWKWFYHKGSADKTGYAIRNKPRLDGKRKTIYMHRSIRNTPHGYDTDHKNGNGLDNRRENLRVATSSQNSRNMDKRRDNTSGYKGVCWYKDRKRWRAYIKFETKRIYLGLFKNKDEAALAYNAAATKLYGEFARLNQVSN